jgi:hypothetical protein
MEFDPPTPEASLAAIRNTVEVESKLRKAIHDGKEKAARKTGQS